ncbi:MAG: Fe(3+) ABC transporter substrate-binding protein [Planctomycetota bacterium]
MRSITSVVALFVAFVTAASAQNVVNVYSSRHYDTDDELFAKFTEETGIEVRLLEADADQLLARIEREGEFSPADVFIAVDAARIHRAEAKGLFAPVDSEVIESRVPANRRHPDGMWIGITERVRVIVASKDRVEDGEVETYEDLIKPELRDRVLIRSSSNVYNQSLVAGMIASIGTSQTEAWCRGIAANLARTPQGGDTDQIRAVAAGEGDVAVVNHYYLARLIDGDAANRAVAEKVEIIFPNQDDRGVHVNICGGGVLKHAPNRDNAIRFLEFLVSDEAQANFAADNYEYPVVEGVELHPILAGFGEFKADELNVADLGENNREAVQLMDRIDWR